MTSVAALRALLASTVLVAVSVLSPSAAALETESAQAPTVLDVRVSAGANDAEERSTGTVQLASADLNLGKEDAVVQTVGLRFTGITVPRGATIATAYVQ